jgi:hypothetical protein
VESNACHTCPTGKTRAAGDDATKGNTTCDATLCKTNEKVVSNKCKGCPPGKSNVADDDASGRNTVCDATICTANQHVVKHACIACPDGTSRPAGDDASGNDTTCSPSFNTGNGYAFKFRVSVRFNSWNGEYYPTIVRSSTGAFQFHGLGKAPAYRGKKGKLTFYFHTVSNVGAHGRGGSLVETRTKLTEGVWYSIIVEKTADQVCIKVNTDASVCSRRSVTAGEFQMKPVGTLSWDAGSNIEGKDFVDMHQA